jgi:hypothetical protein
LFSGELTVGYSGAAAHRLLPASILKGEVVLPVCGVVQAVVCHVQGLVNLVLEHVGLVLILLQKFLESLLDRLDLNLHSVNAIAEGVAAGSGRVLQLEDSTL